MPLLDALFTRFGRPAGRALDPTIRDIVHAVLKEHGYASPAEVQALRDEVRDMRGRVDGMQRRLDDVVRQADEVRGAAAQSVSDSAHGHADAIAALREQISELQAQLSAPRAVATAAAAPAATVATPAVVAPAPLEAAPRGDCKVDGCDAAVRSKGFCSPHYQQWRRGSLKGFAGPEGHVMGVEGVEQVSAEFAGGAVTVVSGKVHVDGQPIS